jgi:hypothetical protein
MTLIEKAADRLNIKPEELIKKSLETYLKQRSSQIESEIFLISKKYGIKDILEMDEKVSKGKISEDVAYDDYFLLDNLQAELEKINNFRREI